MVMQSTGGRYLQCLVSIATCLVASLLIAFGSRAALGQPVLDTAVSEAQLVTKKGCAILKVIFNVRIRYDHHFPISHGNDLRISVSAIDRDQLIALQLLRREAVRVPLEGKLLGIKSIDFETRPAIGPMLTILFDRPMFYSVAQSSDVESVVVAISGKGASPTCRPEFPPEFPAGVSTRPFVQNEKNAINPTVTPQIDVPKERGTGTISEADLRSAAAAMDEARAALKKGNFSNAIQLLIKVLKYPENQNSAEAQELLGLALQRSGQIDAAKAEYEDYLHRYPQGEGNERVKQRLDGMVAVSAAPSEKLQPSPRPNGRPLGNGETTWTFSGSASAFYIRDDSFLNSRDPTVAPNPNENPDDHEVHQNELLTNLDLIATWNNDLTRGKFRFSGTGEFGISADARDRFGVAALFSEIQLKDWDVLTRIGRQYWNRDGVLGRFDGALFSWQALPFARINLVGGSPAVSQFDSPFEDQKWFYGVSVDFAHFLGGWEASLYAIEQRDRWLLDRQAIGSELRYFDESKSLFATVDYDVHFQRLNAAIFSGSWTLFDKSTIYGGADFRRTPYLSTWNALLNQPFLTLYDMLRIQSNLNLEQLVVNETPTYKSAMLGYSRPLTDHFQISADFTVVNLNEPIATSSIDPSLPNLPAGNEYYYSTQFMANNLLEAGDMYILGLRYSQLLDSNMYAIDFNSRYPLNEAFSISPRLRFGYRQGRAGLDLKEYTALPSILVDYYFSKALSFEAEVGVTQTWSEQAGVKNNNTDLFLTVGFRYDFYADGASRDDGKRNCLAPVAAALCRYSNAGAGMSCAAPPTGCR